MRTPEVMLLISPENCSGRTPGSLPETRAESWRAVVGFEGRYEVSDLGGVRRAEGRLLRWSPSKYDYPAVSLGGRRRLVHLLVADAFIGARAPGYEVDHQDGDKNNPRLSNLEIVTHEENVARAVARRHPGRPRVVGWAPAEVPWDQRFHGRGAA